MSTNCTPTQLLCFCSFQLANCPTFCVETRAKNITSVVKWLSPNGNVALLEPKLLQMSKTLVSCQTVWWVLETSANMDFCGSGAVRKQEGPQKLVFRANLSLEQHGGPYRSVLEWNMAYGEFVSHLGGRMTNEGTFLDGQTLIILLHFGLSQNSHSKV